jgi:mRNA-degrading endonuclease HigB of HigAB toxin-antitoxin module
MTGMYLILREIRTTWSRLFIFKVRTVFILFIGTHAAYDKINAGTVEFKK